MAEKREGQEKRPGKGSMTVEEAGRLGGVKVASERGREFYEEIGHKGGQRVKELVAEGKQSEGRRNQKEGTMPERRGDKSQSRQETGRKGGERNASEQGRERYEDVGQKGGQKSGQRDLERGDEGEQAER